MTALHPYVNEEMIQDVQEIRQFYYDLLTQLWSQEPNQKLLSHLREYLDEDAMPLADEEPLLIRGIRQIAESLMMADQDDKEAEAIHWDYTRLFVGPFELPAPPWASAYRDDGRMLFQDETIQVRRAYAKYGYQVESIGQVAEDHIGLELEFMSHLIKESSEQMRGNLTGTKEILRDQVIFLEQHLHSWISLFTKDVRASARTPFYKGCADLLEGWLLLDRQLQDALYQALEESE
ncbi:TorD/DmsD family molecular chaperone [Salisediminibacterium selenitireducens]|uniref:Cytoplasmic chaperone TorD family protein n=1 Tax=Bacillus selenitireducens (strain ATCC 700615 / DSM 15326 / MLS10) TaxID=439292 RepID=D6XU79_BACIE|nr:molecular chaperone TorD family protein [Salisediminibacterium selenitireducens]ADH99365.1 cytoplasmic chaperone TorD family protein [[Bacillus] selenitireducens MLS10]